MTETAVTDYAMFGVFSSFGLTRPHCGVGLCIIPATLLDHVGYFHSSVLRYIYIFNGVSHLSTLLKFNETTPATDSKDCIVQHLVFTWRT